ncbi:MAG: helix-turn-helix domain-containing protein [Bacteroidia bacterium]|nr:helix-turn-helix domain-containing protein [Bacteroidia bacterium]
MDIKAEDQQEKFLTREEAANLLGVNKVTLWRYYRDGRLPYYRVGRKIFFLRSEILRTIRIDSEN